jgi:hypothetical protein
VKELDVVAVQPVLIVEGDCANFARLGVLDEADQAK